MPAPYSGDHEIKIGDTTRSLRLLHKMDKGVEGAAYYTMTEDVPRYANPLSFIQTDWSGGHGQYAFEDPSQYLGGNNIDTSLKGNVTMMNFRTTNENVYNLIAAAVADDGGALTTETTAAINSTTNDMTLMPAVPAVNDAYYFGFGTAVTSLLLNISTAGVGTWTVAWEHWNGSSWVAVGAVTDGTTAFTVSGYCLVAFTTTAWATTAVNSITKYWLRARVATYSAVTTQPKGKQAWAIGGMAAPLVASCWYKTTNSSFCATATKIFEYDSTNTRWIERVEFASNTISHLCEHDSILYVALGIGTKWYYSTDGYAYTITDLTDGYAVKFLVAPNENGTQDRLWFFQTPNELMNTSDGRTVAAGGVQASTPAYISDTSYNIINIFLVNDKIMVGKENGLWEYDTIGGQHPRMLELEQNRSTTNFKYMAYYKGATYFSLIRNIGEITASDYLSIVGPLKDCDSTIGKTGDIVGMTSDEDFLYVAVDEGTNTHIYKGSQVVGIDGNLKWSWCSIQNLTTHTCTLLMMIQDSLTSGHVGRLWFGYDNTIGYIYIVPNPAGETGLYYSGAVINSWLRTSYFYGTNPFWDKLWQSIVIETVNCSATRRVSVYYRDDNDTSATLLVTEFYTNGVQEIKLNNAISNKRISFEIWFGADLTIGVPPEVLYFEAKGIEVPEVTRIHECIYEVGDDLRGLKAKTILDFLDSARTTTSLVKFADLRRGQKTSGTTTGDYVWVIMEPGYPRFIEASHEAGRHPEMGVQCRFREVSYTIS